ncbi:MAG: hydroxyisourate hydrolase [Nannocystaceae bacterium]|nr:hydroxyisourate hydrolase [Nannocystaceae bacterium]
MSSPLTTHVLDVSLGRPARGVAIVLERRDGDGLRELARTATNADGRAPELLPPGGLLAGIYRLHFATAAYFEADGRRCFYPEVVIEFEVTQPGEHHHVPLLLSPFGYSTYRGS